MQSDHYPPATPFAAANVNAGVHSPSTPPLMVSNNVSGPVDPMEFYLDLNSPPTPEDGFHDAVAAYNGRLPPPPPPLRAATALRSVSQSPVRTNLHADTVAAGDRALSGMRSNPALMQSRQPGKVKDMATRFDRSAGASRRQAELAIDTDGERHRRPAPKTESAQHTLPNSASSPESKSGAPAKLYNARRPRASESPQRSPATSFASVSSVSSNATARTATSQLSKPGGSNSRMRPLFGEITEDGTWNTSFVSAGTPSQRPVLAHASRRASEGSLAIGQFRQQPAGDSSVATLQLPAKHLRHRRSRSDLDHAQPGGMPSISIQHPATPDSASRSAAPRTSRIPVSSMRQVSSETPVISPPHSRSPSAAPKQTGLRQPSKSPSRAMQSMGKENEPSPTHVSTPRNRYRPPPLSSPTSNQTLSAKIVAPLPKTSPPLRSSRPRQPVSSAIPATGLAKAAEFQVADDVHARDAARAGDIRLGKPFEPQKDRTRQQIPDLGKIDFEERRARIQRAISQNLHSNRPSKSLDNKSRSASHGQSRTASPKGDPHVLAGAEADHSLANATEKVSENDAAREDVDHQLPVPELALDEAPISSSQSHEPHAHSPHSVTGEESPTLGRVSLEDSVPQSAPTESSFFLSAATYKPPSRKPLASKSPETETSHGPSKFVNPTLLTTDISPFRERDSFLMSATDDSPSVADSASDFGRKWAGASPTGDEGSIRIMLADDSAFVPDSRRWSESVGQHLDEAQNHIITNEKLRRPHTPKDGSHIPNGHEPLNESPPALPPRPTPESTPRRKHIVDQDRRPETSPNVHVLGATDSADAEAGIVDRVLHHYQSTGTLTAEMLEDMQDHMVDLHRLSANGGSNAIVVQNLLDSILQSSQAEHEQPELLSPKAYQLPAVTPDTPTGDEFEPGTVLVYGDTDEAPIHEGIDNEEEEDFETKIRKANEAWERQQRGDDPFVSPETEDRPALPPRTSYFAPPTSIPSITNALTPEPGEMRQVFGSREDSGLDISTSAVPTGDGLLEQPAIRSSLSAPPKSLHAPTLVSLPHDPNAVRPSFGLPDKAMRVLGERNSSELSVDPPRTALGASISSRPSVDSQRRLSQFPASHSASSLAESSRQESIDNPHDSQTRLAQAVSTGPEHKRLSKRRYIIRELLDTENTYYQDLKIIEDIYKATCTPDLVLPEDKKVLFGNCDEVERFALHFYDELRKATTQVYVPAKQTRWLGNKRESQSTTQSDGTAQTSINDGLDDEKDRTTTIGRAFLANLPRMEQIYGSYLKNHDAANQRLAALVGTPSVKCWLDECHANASDITAAWDLDSLLVKPTQRVAKYPMLLQQLLDTTPPDHPDHDDLKSAAKDSISMLTRINEAKKRADLVDQIVNRKRKDSSDVRSGLAKAFGRRTEKLRERVGIAEAFQDPEFDELAHKFGGHFIRLQICMRDVQDYMNRTEKAVELISNYTAALELYTDVWPSSLPEIESKWRRYGQVIRDLTLVAFVDHKAAVQKRVLAPMIQCIKLHDGPQSAINKRKKRIVDYAKCKSDERRGQKADKRTVEASDMYVALNDQLKIELPKLYTLTATLVHNCLNCFLDVQLQWHDTWQRKLRPLLDAVDVPDSIKQIEPAFLPDYAVIEKRLLELSICNGTLRQDTASFMSSSSTAVDSMSPRPRIMSEDYDRTLSVDSQVSISHSRRHSGANMAAYEPRSPPIEGRMQSNSSVAPRPSGSQSVGSTAVGSTERMWSNASTPTSLYSATRPTTANQPPGQPSPRISSEQQQRSSRPSSGATGYFTARPDQLQSMRFSGIFSSAMPPSEQHNTGSVPSAPAAVASPAAIAGASTSQLDVNGSSSHSNSNGNGSNPLLQPQPPQCAPPDTPVLFVCASLFEFSIDRTRREAGYPYLTYVQGEVFDVIAAKGELWLAKNQDDPANTLGWIWEQHFIVLSQE